MRKYIFLLLAALALCACDTKPNNEPAAVLKPRWAIIGGQVDFKFASIAEEIKGKEVYDAVIEQLEEQEKPLWRGESYWSENRLLWQKKTPIVNIDMDSQRISVYCPAPTPELSAKIANLYADNFIRLEEVRWRAELLERIDNLNGRINFLERQRTKQKDLIGDFQLEKSEKTFAALEQEILSLATNALIKKDDDNAIKSIQETLAAKQKEAKTLEDDIARHKSLMSGKKKIEALLSEFATYRDKHMSEIQKPFQCDFIIEYAHVK
jgi:hypothetical protein